MFLELFLIRRLIALPSLEKICLLALQIFFKLFLMHDFRLIIIEKFICHFS